MQAPRKPTIRPIHARDDREPFQTSVRHYHRSSTQQGELPEGSKRLGLWVWIGLLLGALALAGLMVALYMELS
ncbi:MAG TPA: hypothetical protein VFY13_00055 [Luteolibacter sp.]|nr:hypothetical protein [Luteolibacter sp.]